MELWINVDCFAQMFYDEKPVAECLEIERSDDAVVVQLNEEETRRYEEYMDADRYWQARFRTEFDEARKK